MAGKVRLMSCVQLVQAVSSDATSIVLDAMAAALTALGLRFINILNRLVIMVFLTSSHATDTII